MNKEKIYICKCGECFDFDGWNIKEEIRQGNNYHYKATKCYIIKYTFCRCGKEVILIKSKKGVYKSSLKHKEKKE